jgi:aminopeptidase N
MVEFERTPRMSTYLVAFAIHQFEKKEKMTQQGVVMRTWGPKGSKIQDYGLDVAVKVLDFYTELLRQNYTLPKCDLFPNMYKYGGAMENWGLVTFGQDELGESHG